MQTERIMTVVVVSNLGGVASAAYLAQTGRQVILQTRLLGGSLT
jgi:hypothetical protein